jgi:hypothetical protein
MKYIFIVGAPGSKWSSVAKNIHSSPSIDHTDESQNRNYIDQFNNVNHTGAYFDPGMEYGNFFDCIEEYTKEQCEVEFNRPFTGQGVRIIKSHVLAEHIDYLKSTWPECSIITVYRSNDSCMGWWTRAGGWNITYPNYRPYYQDDFTMYQHIVNQNNGISKACEKYTHITITNNYQAAQILNILPPTAWQDYPEADIKVTII